MPRYIDAEIMPHGELWEQLTDKEKLNVLNYLLSRPSVDVPRTIFEEIAGVTVEMPNSPGIIYTSKEAFQMLLDKYNIEGGIEI
jgi:hypothetical protein